MIITRKKLKKIIFEALLKENYSVDTFPVYGDYNVGYDAKGLGNNVDPKVLGKGAIHSSDYRPYPKISKSTGKKKGPHYGIDIFAERGTPVVSPVSGYVTSVSRKNKSGKRIPSRIGGLTVTISTAAKKRKGVSYYHAHLDSIENSLTKGMFVKAGQQIGTVGNTGNARGKFTHLHFGVYGPAGYVPGNTDPFPILMPHLNKSGIIYNKRDYSGSVSVDPLRWDGTNVTAMEVILDKYKDLGAPDEVWTGGEDEGTTDESWRNLIDMAIKLAYPDAKDEHIEIIRYDWHKGASHFGLEGDPAGALEFVKKLDNFASATS